MMDIGAWPDWVRSLVFGVSMIVATIAGLRTARRFRDDPADRKRNTIPPIEGGPELVIGTAFVMYRVGRPSGCGGVRVGREAPGARGPIAGPRGRPRGGAALEPVKKVLTDTGPQRGAGTAGREGARFLRGLARTAETPEDA